MTYLDPVLTATAAVGFLSVVSSPAGAFVYVDGVYRGVTPLTVAATTGLRRIELDHAGYADWSSTAQVTSGATVPVNAHLQLLPTTSSGGIAVSSEPTGAAVYLDDQYRGVTAANGDLELTGVAAGSHTLSVRLEGYDEYRVTVQVTPDATVKIRPRLGLAGNPTVTATSTPLADRGAIQANSTPVGCEGGDRRAAQGHDSDLDLGRSGRPAHGAVLARRLHRARAIGRGPGRADRDPLREPDAGKPGTVGPACVHGPRGTRGRRGGGRPAR